MLIILDRDGVINEDSDEFIKSPDEWIPIPGSLEAIAKLKKAGHMVVVASNQSGVGRGLFTEAVLQNIHQKMLDLLAKEDVQLDGIFYCPHLPEDNCSCRKPKAGLLLQIAEKFNVDLTKAILVGDAERDIQAAQAVNCPAVLVKTGKGAQTALKSTNLKNIPVYENLADFVAQLMNK